MNPDTAAKLYHPIHCATVDILGEIFVHCLAEIPPNGHPDDLDPLNEPECWISEDEIKLRQKQPFALAAVCSSWRVACLATPRLWQNLDVSLNGPALIKAGTAAAMVNDVLRFSGAIPLNVRLFHWYFSTSRHRPWGDPQVDSLVVALQAAIARCGTLVVSGHVSHQLKIDPLGRILRVNTPLLHTASLCGEFWVGSTEDELNPPPEARILPDAGRLRLLEVDGSFLFGLHDVSSCVNVQKANLRVNTWAPYNLDLVFQFLRTAPQLTMVSVDNPLGLEMSSPLPRATSCETVRRMVFNFDHDAFSSRWDPESVGIDWLPIMLNLSFPRLEMIEMKGCEISSEGCITLLRHLISPNHTTTVVLQGMCSTVEFLPALDQARKLRRLTLSGLAFDDQEAFSDWYNTFKESARNNNAWWQQELEELCLTVAFAKPDTTRPILPTDGMSLPVFPHLKCFEVVVEGTPTVRVILTATESVQSAA